MTIAQQIGMANDKRLKLPLMTRDLETKYFKLFKAGLKLREAMAQADGLVLSVQKEWLEFEKSLNQLEK